MLVADGVTPGSVVAVGLVVGVTVGLGPAVFETAGFVGCAATAICVAVADERERLRIDEPMLINKISTTMPAITPAAITRVRLLPELRPAARAKNNSELSANTMNNPPKPLSDVLPMPVTGSRLTAAATVSVAVPHTDVALPEVVAQALLVIVAGAVTVPTLVLKVMVAF